MIDYNSRSFLDRCWALPRFLWSKSMQVWNGWSIGSKLHNHHYQHISLLFVIYSLLSRAVCYCWLFVSHLSTYILDELCFWWLFPVDLPCCCDCLADLELKTSVLFQFIRIELRVCIVMLRSCRFTKQILFLWRESAAVLNLINMVIKVEETHISMGQSNPGQANRDWQKSKWKSSVEKRGYDLDKGIMQSESWES
jgi:hypothetical protein